MTDLEKLLSDAREIASERREKAHESHMMAMAIRNGGNPDGSIGWQTAADYAQKTARILDQVPDLAREVLDLRAEVEKMKVRERMIVSHAARGGTDGVDMSINDICVEITKAVNRVWKEAKEAAEADARADARSDAEEFEGDLWREIRKYLTELHLDWRDYADDGILAEDAVQYIHDCMDEETHRAEAAEAEVARLREALGIKGDQAASFDSADWFWRTMDPDDCGDRPEEAINRAMVGRFCVCEIASSYTGPTRYGFIAPVLDPDSDDEEFVHFATQQEAIDAANARAALTKEAGNG